MTIYGINIEKDGGFWDEVKLRAINNYGQWSSEGELREFVNTAIREICKDLETDLIDNEEAQKLAKEAFEDFE